MKSCLVTGGCGFIGVNLVEFLKYRGFHVRIIDNLRVGRREDLQAVTDFEEVSKPGRPGSGMVELMVGDVTDAAAVQAAMDGVDVVVHLAAHTGVIPSLENPRFDCEQNVLGTLTVLDAAKKADVKGFVFASSGAPLGDQQPPLNEEKVPKPLSPYGASKLAGEAYCSAYHGSFGMNTVALRFSNAYGPYSFKKGSVVAEFFRRILAGKPLTIYGDGGQTRDFIHVRDLCQAIAKAAESDCGGEVFQIATGMETTVGELVRKICALVENDLDTKVEIRYEPEIKGAIKRSVADISKARRLLGYEPEVSLDEGLAETWRWFESVTKNDRGGKR